MYRKYKRLQGGFLWEWYDHGIYTEEKDKKYYKYGGNYGDFPTNGNFCIDGILMPDRTPSPGMEEYKQIIAPVEITAVEGSMNKIQIRNYYDFLNLDTTTLYWEVKAEDQMIQDGTVEGLSVAPHEGKIIALPITAFELQENTDYYLNLTVCQKEERNYAPAGYEIKKVQIPMQIRKDGFSVRETADKLQVTEEQGAYCRKQPCDSKIQYCIWKIDFFWKRWKSI